MANKILCYIKDAPALSIGTVRNMNVFELKYGCNPNQKPAKIFMANGSDLPIEILCGKPGYINFLDAFNSWQLVKELKEAT